MKLNEEEVALVDDAEIRDFEPVPDGAYVVQLMDVEANDGPTAVYWTWKLSIDEDSGSDGEEYNGRFLYVNTSLSPKAAFTLKAAFAAFGVPTTADTNDILGSFCRVNTRIASYKDNDGNTRKRNETTFIPADEEE